MARDLTSAFQTAITADNVYLAYFVVGHFPSGDLNVWTGYGDITWNSITFTGAGHLLKFSPIEETQKLEAVGMKFVLSGNITALVELAEAEQYQNRPIEVYRVLFSSAGVIVNDPYQVFSGLMDVMAFEDDAAEPTIELSAENRLIDLDRPRKRYWTKEDQNLDYPLDTFFDFVTSIQDKEISWGG